MNLLDRILKKVNINNSSSNIEKPKKALIYDKIIPIVNTDTDGRQKIIKKLLKENDISLSEDIFQESLFCECDIKEPEFKSKTKILEVYANIYYEESNNTYPYTLGYITNEYQELFNDELHNNTYYSTSLYVSKNEKLYTLDVRIQFYKNS